MEPGQGGRGGFEKEEGSGKEKGEPSPKEHKNNNKTREDLNILFWKYHIRYFGNNYLHINILSHFIPY